MFHAKRSNDCGENRRHCNHVGVNKALADCRCHSAAEERASQIKKSGHYDGLARREDFGRDDSRDRVGGVVKAVAVFENDCRDYDDEEREHRRSEQPATNTSTRPEG